MIFISVQIHIEGDNLFKELGCKFEGSGTTFQHDIKSSIGESKYGGKTQKIEEDTGECTKADPPAQAKLYAMPCSSRC